MVLDCPPKPHQVVPRRGGQLGACEPDDLHQDLSAFLVESCHRDPVTGSIGWLDTTAALQRHGAIRQETGTTALDEHAGPTCAQLLGELVPLVAEHDGCGLQEPLAARVPRDSYPLEGEDLLDDLPAAVERPQDIGIAGPQAVDEELVEMMGTQHALDWADFDRGILHRDQEHGDAVLLAFRPCRAREEEAPLRHPRIGGPDLLPADPPTLSVAPGRGLQRSEVGASIGLAESLAPDDLAPSDRRQVLPALLVGPVTHDRRADPVDPHVLGTPRLMVRPHLFTDDGLLPRRRTSPTKLGRPVCFDQGTQFVPQGGGLRTHVVVHRARFTDSEASSPVTATLGLIALSIRRPRRSTAQ